MQKKAVTYWFAVFQCQVGASFRSYARSEIATNAWAQGLGPRARGRVHRKLQGSFKPAQPHHCSRLVCRVGDGTMLVAYVWHASVSLLVVRSSLLCADLRR